MKLASWNVNSLRVRLPHVLDWLKSEQPDILGLQEIKLTNDNFPEEEIRELGYEVTWSGQKTYNGVALISKLPATDIMTDIPGLDDPQRRVLAATIGDVRFIDLYVPNGSEVGSEKYDYKLNWLEKLHDWLAEEIKQHDKLCVVGDFNIAPDDRDVHDPEEWVDKILCSKPERNAYEGLLDLGLTDSYRAFEQKPEEFSWWDYRAAGFRRNRGLRIDLVLLSDALQKDCKRSWIDKEPRKLERPSDHAPVIAEVISE